MELQGLVGSEVVYVPMDGRYIKPVTLRHNPQANRIEMITLGWDSEFCKGSTLVTTTLGLDDSQLPLAGTSAHWKYVSGKGGGTDVEIQDGALSLVNGDSDSSKQKAANIDNVRQLGFHVPTLVQSSYDRNGSRNL